VHVYRGLIERAKHEVEWASEGLRLVDRLERDAGGQGSAGLAGQPDDE
jgi:hypothetical protein